MRSCRLASTAGLALVLSCAAAVGGSAPAAPAPAGLLDVNDVTLLFAMGNDGLPFPTIPVTELAGGQALWTQEDFDRFIQFATHGRPGEPDSNPQLAFFGGADRRESYRVVGLRFDPCAPTPAVAHPSPELRDRLEQVGLPVGCLVQLRLVAQPFRAGGGGARDLDMTAHLVFSFGAGAAEKAVAGLRRIRDRSVAAGAPTAGVPLGVHPGLASEATEVADAVRELVLELAALPAIRTVAFMGLKNPFEPWVFLSGSARPTEGGGPPRWTPLPIPSFAPSQQVFHQRLSFIEPERVIPAPTQPVNTRPLFHGSRDAALAFGVDDPLASHIPVTDCVSCHTSTSRILILDLPVSDARVPSPAGVTGYARRSVLQGRDLPLPPPARPEWNVRNLGYFMGHPTVSLRTVAESAEVARMINLELTPEAENPARRAGPGPDCSAHDHEVWTCMVASDGDDCLAVCDAAPGP